MNAGRLQQAVSLLPPEIRGSIWQQPNTSVARQLDLAPFSPARTALLAAGEVCRCSGFANLDENSRERRNGSTKGEF
jgi:hypothetical protein